MTEALLALLLLAFAAHPAGQGSLAAPRPVSPAPLHLEPADLAAPGAATSWHWTFEGGTPASSELETPPPVRFATVGVKTVSLTACNAAGCSTATRSITVLDPTVRIQSAVAAPNPALAGDLVTFTAAATGKPPIAYTWTIAGGPTLAGNPAAWSTSGAAGGDRAVALSACNSLGCATAGLTLSLHALVRSWAPVCPGICLFPAGTVVAFTLVSQPAQAYDYDWDGDGTFEQTSPVPIASHLYPLAGSFFPAIRARQGAVSDTFRLALPITLYGGSSDALFADGFDSGNTSAWSASTGLGSTLFVSPAAAHDGPYGLRVKLTPAAAALSYVEDQSPAGETHYRARFFLDPHSLTMPDMQAFKIFFGLQDVPRRRILTILLRKRAGGYEIRVKARTNAGEWARASWTSLPDRYTSIEVEWAASTGPGAPNGFLTVSIDGALTDMVADIDNAGYRIDLVRMGTVGGLETGNNGSLFFDSFSSSNGAPL